jgi:hypothetical protein
LAGVVVSCQDLFAYGTPLSAVYGVCTFVVIVSHCVVGVLQTSSVVLRRLGVVVGGQLFLRICRGLLTVGVVLVSLELRGVVGISAMRVLRR